MEPLHEFAREYFRPQSDLDNWFYETDFDFHIEVHFLMNPVQIGE